MRLAADVTQRHKKGVWLRLLVELCPGREIRLENGDEYERSWVGPHSRGRRPYLIQYSNEAITKEA